MTVHEGTAIPEHDTRVGSEKLETEKAAANIAVLGHMSYQFVCPPPSKDGEVPGMSGMFDGLEGYDG